MASESKTPVSDRFVRIGRKYVPTNVFFEVTAHCNAACEYCYLNTRTKHDDLDTASCLAIIDRIAESQVMFLSITGGEPFFRPDILELLQHALEKDFFGIGLFTNGILLNQSHLRFLAANRSHIRNISMSVFSHVPAVNDGYFRVDGALDKILCNAGYLRDAGINVLMKINVQDFNVESFPDTIAFLEEKGFDVAANAGVCLSSTRRLPHLEEFNTKNFFDRVYGKMPRGKVQDETAYISGNEGRSGFCAGLYTTAYIDHSGEIRPCVAFDNLSCGTVLESTQTLGELLRDSDEYRKVRSLRMDDFEECRSCDVRNQCVICAGEMHNFDPNHLRPVASGCSRVRSLAEHYGQT